MGHCIFPDFQGDSFPGGISLQSYTGTGAASSSNVSVIRPFVVEHDIIPYFRNVTSL
jgi:hypothetical protein